eukprot:396909_1
MFTSISHSSKSITSHNTANSSLPPGTWIKRPTSGQSSLRSRVGLVALIYHHAIIIYGNIIIEFTASDSPDIPDKHSSAQIGIAGSSIHEWSVVKTPTDESHSKLIIKRALTKYGISEEYNATTNNCEHFVHFCYFGYKRCKQIQSLLLSNGMGFAGAASMGLIKSLHVSASVPTVFRNSANHFDLNVLAKGFRRHIASGIAHGVKGFYDFTILNTRLIWSWYHNSAHNLLFINDRIIILDLVKYQLLKNTAIYGSLFWISGYVLCYLCFPTMRQIGSIAIQCDQTQVDNIKFELGAFDRKRQNREELQKEVAKILFQSD